MKTMIKRITYALLFTCLISNAQAQNTITQNDSTAIYLYRGSFNDALPEFEIKIYQNGKVDYKGIKNTPLQGEKYTNIDVQDIEIFFITAQAMSFFDLQTSYTENLFAVEKAIIAMNDKQAGKYKCIMRRGKTPRAVHAMEDRIIKTVEKALTADAAKN